MGSTYLSPILAKPGEIGRYVGKVAYTSHNYQTGQVSDYIFNSEIVHLLLKYINNNPVGIVGTINKNKLCI